MRLEIKHNTALRMEKEHNITVSEVFEVLEGAFLYKRIKGNRYRIIGKTMAGRILMLLIDKKDLAYELVTAKDSTDSEKRLYKKEIGW